MRGPPTRLAGRSSPELPQLRLGTDPSSGGLPGWLTFGNAPDREIALRAVGKFRQPDIDLRDVSLDRFGASDESGNGARSGDPRDPPNGPDRKLGSYECRTATTDPRPRRKTMRYW